MKSLIAALALLAATPAFATIADTTEGRQTRTGNAATTTFVYTFPAGAATDVTATVTLGGIVQAAPYTVTLNGDQTNSPGGTVIFTTAPANLATITLQRNELLTQQTSLPPFTPFPAKTVERTFDASVRKIQQVDRRVADLEAKETADISNTIAGGIGAASLLAPLATGSTTAITLSEEFSYVHNVRRWGADNTGAVDASSSIQSAIDSLPATGGKVFMPCGTYKVNTAIVTTKPSLVIEGEAGMGWNSGSCTNIVTTAAIYVFTFGSASATEHRGVQVQNLSINDTGGIALGAIRDLRENQTTVRDVSINGFVTGAALTYDGTGDAVTVPQIIGVKGRDNKFGIVQVGVVTAMWVAPSTYFAKSAPNAGSIAITYTGDTILMQGAVDSYETAVKITGDDGKFMGGRYEGNTLAIWVAGPTSRRNIIVGNTFAAGGTAIQIDSGANIFDTVVANNTYAAPAVTVVDNTLAGNSRYIFDAASNLWRTRKTFVGSLTHELNNTRQAGAATDIAEYTVMSNGIGATLQAGADGVVRVGSTTASNFLLARNNVNLLSLGLTGFTYLVPVTFANLGTGSTANFTTVPCSDCTIANPCAGGGTGAFAKRLNNVWVCN